MTTPDPDDEQWLDLPTPTTGQPGLPPPVDLDQLDADDLRAAWIELDGWVEWLRRTYGLPATVIPPAWHRHPALTRELSALHQHWRAAYHPTSHPSTPHTWHRDLADTIERLRHWTTAADTGLHHDRPPRHTPWPGDPPHRTTSQRPLTDRRADFHDHLAHLLTDRQANPPPRTENHD